VLDWIASLRQALHRPLRPNRRRERRDPYKVTIEIRTSSGGIYPGVSRDVSLLGMGAIVTAPLALGEQVLIKYEHPAGEQATRSVVRRAIVKQRFGYRYGFEFDETLDL